MAASKSFGNVLSRFRLAVGGAAQHKAALPARAGKHADALAGITTRLESLNSEQEAAKKRVKDITAEMKRIMKTGGEHRSRLVKFAEGTFGARSSEMDQFRPKTEGQLRKRGKKKEEAA